MNALFEISAGSVIDRGTAHNGQEYIVYISGDGSVRVNTYFTPKDGVYSCCVYYDRKLCGKAEEYPELTAEYVESQAYGSFMDGAR